MWTRKYNSIVRLQELVQIDDQNSAVNSFFVCALDRILTFYIKLRTSKLIHYFFRKWSKIDSSWKIDMLQSDITHSERSKTLGKSKRFFNEIKINRCVIYHEDGIQKFEKYINIIFYWKQQINTQACHIPGPPFSSIWINEKLKKKLLAAFCFYSWLLFYQKSVLYCATIRNPI